MNYKIIYTKQAVKDYEKIKQYPALLKNLQKAISVVKENPFTLPYEKLGGNMQGTYSRRINIQHRLIYQIIDDKTVKVLRMWTHYE